VTEDFANAARFEVGQTYRLTYRDPSSPGVKTGISLTKEGIHHGWLREASRRGFDDVLEAGKVVLCKFEGRGRRWKKWDLRLGVEREWQEGSAFYWTEEGVPSDKVTSSSLVESP
jgi:hypothetical protein